MQVVENVALISINATLVAQLVSFLVFMVLLNRIMIRPLRKIMTERQSYIQKVGDELTAAGEAFDQISGQVEIQEAQARQTAFKIRDEIETTGRQSVAGMLDKTKQEIDGLRSEAQAETDRKIADARKNIEAEAETLSDQMVAALLGPRRVS